MSREALKEIRKSKMSLEELSERTGISTSQLSRFESCEREPRIGEAVKLAETLGVDIGDIFPELRPKTGDQSTQQIEDKSQRTPELRAVLDAVEGSYHMLGLDAEVAAVLLKLVVKVAQEPPTPSAGPNFYRVQSELEARKFLQSRQLLKDGA